MASNYNVPGVYVEEISKFPPSVAQVETAIPAFIGFTKQAIAEDLTSLVNIPTRISSLLEYEKLFGGPQSEEIVVTINDVIHNGVLKTRTILNSAIAVPSKHSMYYHLQMFYANGGGPCYIISVGDYLALGADIPTKAGANNLSNGLAALEAADEPTLIIFPELATGLTGNNAMGDVYDLYDDALDLCNKLKDRFTLIDLYNDTETSLRDGVDGIGMSNLKYGAAYHPYLKTSLTYYFQDDKISIAHNEDDGVNNVPGKFDGKKGTDIKLSDLGIYNQILASLTKIRITLPPSSTIAGIYASTDNARGVWKAPANVSVRNANGLTKIITDEQQGNLNIDVNAGKSVNVIRSFPGKGILVWGARTLDGNSSEWRYISVRRLFIMVEESVKKATAQFVFEPNDENTWTKVRAMIENYLTVLWRQGALAGAKPEHAFYVKCAINETMTQQEILSGFMNIEIGMAAVRPAEFILLRFSHKMQES